MTRLLHASAQGQPVEDDRYTYSADDELLSIASLASASLLPQAKTIGQADAANRIAQFDSATLAFDSEGQTTSKTAVQGATRYDWDSRGRLKQAALPNGQSVNYGYDPLGRLSSRTAAGVSASFLYDGADVVLDRTSSGGATDYLNGVGVDEKLRLTSPGFGPLYFIQDHLGSTAALTDVTGLSVERLRYEPFGGSAGSALTRFDFTGRERDGATGLMYYRARWYDPSQGRFLTEDPIGFLGGDSNLYSYARNNPVSLTDPSGELPQIANGSLVGRIDDPLINYISSGGKVSGRQLAAGIVREAIVGGAILLLGPLGARLGPIAGTLFDFGVGAAAGALGQAAANQIDPCNQSSILLAAISGGATGAVAGGVGRAVEARLVTKAAAPVAGEVGVSVATEAAQTGENSSIRSRASQALEGFPPNNGFLGEPERRFLMPGEVFDRFGRDSGRYAAPVGTPFGTRGLPLSSASKPFSIFRVVKPFEVEFGPSSPAFGQRGLRTQFRFPVPINILLKRGIIERINR